jgi:hypothetical protein
MAVAASRLRKSSPGRYDHLVRPEGLVHRSVYCDPQIFAEEMVQVFGASWVFLLHETEIPEQNDFKTITVGRRPTARRRQPIATRKRGTSPAEAFFGGGDRAMATRGDVGN